MRLTTGAILFFLAFNPSFAQESARPTEPVERDSDDIDAYIRRRMRKDHVPGVSVAIIQDGKVVRSSGHGMANLELSTPATENTAYQIASVTKPFTATAVMMLVEEGKLGLDDEVARHLPDLPAGWGKVTVRHLLSHTSGIKNLTDLESFPETMRKDFTPRELVGKVAKEPLEFAPGEKWSYSNTGYIVLGTLIEKVTGKNYGEFMGERIFKRLGMTNTRANDLHAIIPGRAQGYTWDGKALRIGEYHSASQPFAAGMLVSTTSDLSKWDAALDAGKLLKKSSLEEMWTPALLNSGEAAGYGFGWELKEVNGHRLLSHGGGIPGFSTHFARYVDDHLTVIVLTNSDNANVGSLSRGIVARMIPALSSQAEKPIADADASTTERLKGLIQGVAKGDVDPELFAEKSKEGLVPRLKGDKERFSSFGALKAFGLYERKESDRGVRLRYRALFDHETMDASFGLDNAGKIVGLGFRQVE